MFIILALLLQGLLGPQTGVADAHSGPFHSVVIAVPDFAQFEKEWMTPTEGARITSTDRLIRNKPTFLEVIVRGCQTQKDGQCRIAVTHQLTAPDGSIYGGQEGVQRIKAAVPVSRPDGYFLVPTAAGVHIEPGEQLGTYALTTSVEDVVAKRRVTIRLKLTAVESE